MLLLIAALHLYILVLENVPRRTPLGRRAFGTTAEFAATRVLAANQGLYNAFWRWGWHGATGVGIWRCNCSFSRVGGRRVRRADRQPQNSVVQALPAAIAILAAWAAR
ncbi:DUF1304 domain-containing protein [Serratia ureilytica]